jgi:hypothetical protein
MIVTPLEATTSFHPSILVINKNLKLDLRTVTDLQKKKKKKKKNTQRENLDSDISLTAPETLLIS